MHMAFEWLIIILAWGSVIAFFALAIFRVVKIAAMPLTLRWEVYPIPHEARERREYGGSYMEEVGWAGRHTRRSFLAELIEFLLPEAIEIGAEIVTMRKVRRHNRYGLWAFSTLLHWGIYAYVLWLLLLAALNLFSLAALAGLATVLGWGACALGALGAVGLIVKRAATRDLARYTAPVDYFNLVLLAAIFIVTGLGWVSAGSFAAHRAFVGSVLFLRPAPVPAVVALGFILVELFAIYMPFSKMLHYVIKYFVYHQGLWDDAFKAKGSPTDRQVIEQLGYAVKWNGAHVAQGKTWLEQAQGTGEEGNKR